MKLKVLAAGVMMAVAGPAMAAELTISCGAVGAELQLCKEGVQQWEAKTGNTVNVVSTPNSSTERLSLYQQILNAQSSDIDVMQIDIVWPGMLGSHLVDLRKYLPKNATDGFFDTLIDSNTVDGRLVAMPWFTDAGVLYYRKDLLEKYDAEVPETWTALTDTATRIQQAERDGGKGGMWGYVFQGSAYEGLTVNALEWIASFGGGTIVDDEGEVTVNNPQAAKALTLASTWVNTISPPGVLNYTEEEARGVFQSGNAVFMRNWPYAWSLAQADASDIKDKVGVTQLPKGGNDGQHAAGLGGWNLAVSRYSDHPELAAQLVAFLTSPEEQKRRALEGAYNPTIAALYKDQDVLKAAPFFGTLYTTFTSAVARPSAVTRDKYPRVSNAFFNTVHKVLSGQTTAEQGLEALEGDLDRVKRRRW
ncbi:ABC transporter substrate-binding protein [Larsenimonas rhizosphaerae]|uniref:ABC transporter substrate-binding protein n=1 Tax=Larsenimonas rhizosphaerae TaxID=2944682 RepID=A0AA41ZMZ5_9GAMM|nr:ABC transporter substrate-binding protein [Larsenimonas rhizosphaerae]MCM2131170.1 ABC transporter substrate-binding protein [Larsenimonas rhizosphaerae]MCX2523875.1 ABC transporter substrate-binding protein [Larsenimonas rhizosphaerae]